jgi:hypothetical protein
LRFYRDALGLKERAAFSSPATRDHSRSRQGYPGDCRSEPRGVHRQG